MLREVLENVGFKPKFPETHKNPSAKGTRSKSPTKSPSNSRQATPKRSVSPKPASPAKPQLTEFQKKDCEFIFEFTFLLNSHGNLDYDLLMICIILQLIKHLQTSMWLQPKQSYANEVWYMYMPIHCLYCLSPILIAVVNKLQRAMPKVEKSFIEMALQVCDYDETRAKAVLSSTGDRYCKTL